MLKQKLQADQIQALKAGDKIKLETLRYILSKIKNKEIEKQAELTDKDTVEVLRKTAKELNESIEAFKKGGRADLINSSQKQLTIVNSYLPQQISDDKLQKEIEKIIANHQDLYQKSPKALIGICIKELKDKADPSRIAKLLQLKKIVSA